MNRNIRFLAVMLILVLALTACQAESASIQMQPEAAVEQPVEVAPAEEPVFTVTFEGKQCSFSGMDTLTAGKPVTMVTDVTDQNEYETYGFVMVTLEEGWTKADLEAWKSVDQPWWADVIAIMDEVPAGTQLKEEKWMPLADSPKFKDEAYLACFTCCDPLSLSSIAGPIKMITE